MSPTVADAMALWERGELTQAIAVCRAILEKEPRNASAWHALGLLSFRQKDYPGAVSALSSVIQLQGSTAPLLCDLGAAHALSGNPNLAAEQFSEAIQLEPGQSRAWNNLGNAHKACGRIEEARHAYLEAIRLSVSADAACSKESVAIDAHYNLANLLREEGDYRDAIEHYERALALNSDRYDVLTNLGSALQAIREPDKAISAYRQALAIEPLIGEALASLGALLAEQDEIEEGSRLIEQAARLRPDRPLWGMRSVSMCPTVFLSEADVEDYRTDLEARLDTLAKIEFKYPDEDALAADAFTPSFNLAHHGHDNRRLMQKFAAIFAPHIRPRRVLSRPGRPRVGFLVTSPHEGGFLRTMGGVIDQLDDAKFQTVVFCPAHSMATCRQVIRRDSIEWIALPARFSRAADCVAQAGCRAIYFHKVGADSLGYLLPFARLAPIQFTSWSTHMTSGVPQVDFYLSSRSIETEQSDQHYSEHLVRFKSFPIHEARREELATATRAEFGLPAAGSLYVCPQRLAKFHPADDVLLKSVLEADPSGHLVIVSNAPREAIVHSLVRRLRQSLGPAGGRLVVVPPREYLEFRRMLSVCDVFLDMRKFGSGLMAFDAISVDLPIVAFTGPLKVERYAHAFYDQMGIAGPLVASEAEYVDVAVQLARPGETRERVRRAIRETKGVLFNDHRVVKEYERFLEEAMASG